VAIGLTTVSTAILALFFNYRQLVGMSNITVVIQYLFTCLAVPILRKRQPAPGKSWRIPGGNVVPYAGAAGSLALLVWPIWRAVGKPESTEAWFIELVFAAGTFAAGLLVALFMWRRRPSAQISGSS
jgi:amino acid transporter